MKAPPEVQLQLIELQGHDSALARLEQRRRTLPQLAQLEALERRLAQLSDEIVRAETELSDIAREQRKVENDVDVVASRMERDQQRLDKGQVGSPRELENLQHELVSLARRKGHLEDEVLERMEVREAVELRLVALRREREQLTGEREVAESLRDEAWQEIDAEAERERAARVELAPRIPEDLTALYERIRASAAGVGAAILHRGRCEGCHLSLGQADLDRLRKAPADEVVRCEECRRILVRPAAGTDA